MLAADSRPLRSPLEVLWALATVSCNDAEAAAVASSGQWRRANIMMDIFKTSRIYRYTRMFGLVQQPVLASLGIEMDRVSRNHPKSRYTQDGSLKVTAGVTLQGGSTDPWLYILTLSRLKAIHGHSIKIEQNMPVELLYHVDPCRKVLPSLDKLH